MDPITFAILAGAGFAVYYFSQKNKNDVGPLLTRVKEPIDGGNIMADVSTGDISSTLLAIQKDESEVTLRAKEKDGKKFLSSIRLKPSIYAPTIYTYGGKDGTVITVTPFSLVLATEKEAEPVKLALDKGGATAASAIETVFAAPSSVLNESLFIMQQRKLDETLEGKADKTIGNLIQRITIKGFSFPASEEEGASPEQRAMAAMVAFLRKGDVDYKVLTMRSSA